MVNLETNPNLTPPGAVESKPVGKSDGATERPGLPMSPIDMIGAVFAAMKSDCTCRTCKILRGMADKMADSLIPPDEESSS